MPDTREPLEKEMDAADMMDEMGFCHKCKGHKPCTCVDSEMSQDWHMGYHQKPGCINCGSLEARAGGFCGSKCKDEYIGEV